MRLKVEKAFTRDDVQIGPQEYAVRTVVRPSMNHAGGKMTAYFLQTIHPVEQTAGGATVAQPVEVEVTDLVESGAIEVVKP